MVKRIRYYSPYFADFNEDILLNKGVKKTRTQKAFKNWYANWDKLNARMTSRGVHKKTRDKYTHLFGTGRARNKTFKANWAEHIKGNPSLMQMSSALKRLGYWPAYKEDTSIPMWKSYSKRMFTSLVDQFHPKRIYKPLHRPVNRLILLRALKAARGSMNLVRRKRTSKKNANSTAVSAPPQPRRSSRIAAKGSA